MAMLQRARSRPTSETHSLELSELVMYQITNVNLITVHKHIDKQDVYDYTQAIVTTIQISQKCNNGKIQECQEVECVILM